MVQVIQKNRFNVFKKYQPVLKDPRYPKDT